MCHSFSLGNKLLLLTLLLQWKLRLQAANLQTKISATCEIVTATSLKDDWGTQATTSNPQTTLPPQISDRSSGKLTLAVLLQLIELSWTQTHPTIIPHPAKGQGANLVDSKYESSEAENYPPVELCRKSEEQWFLDVILSSTSPCDLTRRDTVPRDEF